MGSPGLAVGAADWTAGGTIGGAEVGWVGCWGVPDGVGGWGGSYIDSHLVRQGRISVGECWCPAISLDCLAVF
jgi:hypothetical protein